jgi:hypothetical protein
MQYLSAIFKVWSNIVGPLTAAGCVSYCTEGVGFEPTEPFSSPVFKTGAMNRSATLPGRY